jgi:hypothetical protein
MASLTPHDPVSLLEGAFAFAIFALLYFFAGVLLHIASRIRLSSLTQSLRRGLPAVYPLRFYVTGGGLISYGPDPVDAFRRTAGYLDRILKGEDPADLPVQAPTKFEL